MEEGMGGEGRVGRSCVSFVMKVRAIAPFRLFIHPNLVFFFFLPHSFLVHSFLIS